ncbi:8884_t:CDS:2, partial [Funneliformis caledonium]
MSTVEIIGARKTLWCITRNNKSIFKATAGVDNDIYDLKEIIAEKIPNKMKQKRLEMFFTNDAGSNIRIIVGLSVNTDEHQ